jgi:hypothetical protein
MRSRQHKQTPFTGLFQLLIRSIRGGEMCELQQVDLTMWKSEGNGKLKEKLS